MNILILGPQGSGKGTQAELLSQRFGFIHMESGRFLREIAKTNKRIDEIMMRGDLVPTDETIELIEAHLASRNAFARGVIFDGFPRDREQYFALKEWLSTKGQKPDIALVITITEDETIRRLSARRTCEKCGRVYNIITNPPQNEGVCEDCGGNLVQRKDDEPETIKRRLLTYHARTQPMLEAIRTDGILYEFDGERPIEEIQKDLVKVIETHM